MRPGKVVTIRINPKDCMGILDVLELSNQRIPGASFPVMASLTLSSLLETMRQNGIIPTRDGFEFDGMMREFIEPKRTKTKLEIADAIHSAGSDMRIRPVHMEIAKVTPPGVIELKEQEVTGDLLRARTRLSELLSKQDLADSGAGVVWSEGDQQEFDALYKIVYPHG